MNPIVLAAVTLLFQLHQATATVTIPSNTLAEQWVAHREEPLAQQQAEDAKRRKHPVRRLVKNIGKNYAHAADEMGKDMAFVFSSDFDPRDKRKAPVNKPAIVLEMSLVDGSTSYLWRFPDNSFAVQGGFADNSILVPIQNENREWVIKYPNGTTGRVVRKGDTTTVYRPDDSITTIKKAPSGDYTVRNDKIGYMGEAHTDRTGLQYELGSWTRQDDQDL
jgi:hypothetical protein